MVTIFLAILVGPLLWLVGAIVFDGVHWWMHVMLRSRFALLRTLAYPHQVHHLWIDRELATHYEYQAMNIGCHIVPEYATQLLFTAFVSLVLPLPFVVVLFLLQTIVFLGVSSARGRDINHRPEPRIDAHPAGWLTPPSYHLLHHVWPDAYFSAYTKVVDWIVGGGAQIAERRHAWIGPDSTFKEALRDALSRAGGIADFESEDRASADVLVIGDPELPLAGPVEAFIDATRDRQIAPEVWALRSNPEDPVARHYVSDVRVVLRTLQLPDGKLASASRADAEAMVRRALYWIRRDLHFMTIAEPMSWAAMRRFRSTLPVEAEGAHHVRHRMEFVTEA